MTRPLPPISVVGWLMFAGCSFVLDFESDQCTIDADCSARGDAFRGAVCREGTCQSTGTGGAGATVASRDGADAAGADTTGAAGAAGETTGCVSSAQCSAAHLDEPYVCREPGTPCVALKTPECPLVFGEHQDPNAILVGALLDVPATAPLSQMSTLNVELAMSEIQGSVGGLPGGPLGKLRPLVAVVCRNEPELTEVASRHLFDDVGVHAIMAHLPSAELKRFFVDEAVPRQAFVINPGFADNSLTSLSSGGLFWHMIGDIRDVAPAYAPLLARIERHLRPSPDTEPPLRVAMLVADRFAEQSIADTIVPLLEFNGKSVLENGADFYTASVPALPDQPDADYSTINAELLELRPDVVIALTREELVYRILPALEGEWERVAGSQRRPFYILPTALSGNTDLLEFLAVDATGAPSDERRQRVVGVAPASAEDMALYEQFLVRFRTAYPKFENPGGFENFYDAVYLLANAIFAAGSVPELTGADIARGVQRVISGDTLIPVGPTRLADGFSALAAGGSIRLDGTMGPADFDPGVGARRGNGSVFCVEREGEHLAFAYDVLRYRAQDQSLEGALTCIPGL